MSDSIISPSALSQSTVVNSDAHGHVRHQNMHAQDSFDLANDTTPFPRDTLPIGDNYLMQSPSYSAVEKKIAQLLATSKQRVQYSIDNQTKQVVLRIINTETQEIIRQFPGEDSLKIARMVVDPQTDKGSITDARI